MVLVARRPADERAVDRRRQSVHHLSGSGLAARRPGPAGLRPAEASHALAAFELRTGRVLWQRWIDGDAISAPVAADGELIVATFGGTVYRFAQADGRILSARRERATSAPTARAS